jgi:hypothetical protein
MSFKGFLAIALALALLVGLFVVFPKLPPPSKEDEPELSRFTHYPTWHGVLKGM